MKKCTIFADPALHLQLTHESQQYLVVVNVFEDKILEVNEYHIADEYGRPCGQILPKDAPFSLKKIKAALDRHICRIQKEKEEDGSETESETIEAAISYRHRFGAN